MTSSTLIVLAAGRSSRYGRSKVLEPVGPDGECLLDVTLASAARVGLRRAVVVCRSEQVAELEPHLAAAELPARLVLQTTDDLVPGGCPGADGVGAPKPGGPADPTAERTVRTRPWGTGHAVLAARHDIDGPFAVANADDFYGPEAWGALAAHLSGCATNEGVIVSFPAESTLSDEGGVSRGWVQEPDGEAGATPEARPATPEAGPGAESVKATPEAGPGARSPTPAESGPNAPRPVAGLVELLELRRVDDGHGPHGGAPSPLVGIDPTGQRRQIAPDTPVSMNLWALSADVMPRLERAFVEWLAAAPGPDDEFALSTSLDRLLRAGQLRLTHVPAGRLWAGLTHPGDRDRVRALLCGSASETPSPDPDISNGVSP
jgi:hypothetical protein